MSTNDTAFALGVFLAGLARGLAHEQRRLDDEYARELQEFQPVLKLAQQLGYEEAGRAVAPRRMVVERAQVEVSVHVSASRETERAVGVRLVNLRYSRRYQYSRFVENTVRLTVQSVPLTDGAGPQKQ